MSHHLLEEWASWAPGIAPFVFPGDEDAIARLKQRDQVLSFATWSDYSEWPEFDQPSETKLHLGLLPHPFAGDLLTAKVIVLMLNPGLGPSDAFGEESHAEYRAALLANLRQEPGRGGGFPFLDTHFGWHGGFGYWHAKFREVIRELARRWDVTYPVARNQFRRALATLELVPYHSSHFGVPRSVVDRMRSVQLAREFAREVLLPRARSGDCLLLVTRSARNWRLDPEPNVLVYDKAETRGAYLTPRSRGGERIIRFLAPEAQSRLAVLPD